MGRRQPVQALWSLWAGERSERIRRTVHIVHRAALSIGPLPWHAACAVTDDLDKAMFYAAAKGSLPFVFDGYRRQEDGAYYFRGERPGPDWHAAGTFDVHPHVLHMGALVPIVVRKQRWRRRDRSKTCHSRPPDDIGRRYCSLVVVLSLTAWFHAAVGLHRFDLPFEATRDRPSRRSIQRWWQRARPVALLLQQALLDAALLRSEPRWEEQVPRGLPPPGRRWRGHSEVYQLFNALTAVLVTTRRLQEAAPIILTEARRRWNQIMTHNATT